MKYLLVYADDSPASKVAQDMLPFFESVVQEIARHVPEKGYGYRDPDWIYWFIDRTKELAESYVQDPENTGEALDIAAMAGFAWLHQTKSIDTSEKRSKP